MLLTEAILEANEIEVDRAGIGFSCLEIYVQQFRSEQFEQ